MSGDLNKVVAGVGVGRGVEGDDCFVDRGGIRFVCSVVEDGGEAGAGVFEWLAKADELGGDGGGIGAAETDDTDATAAGRRGYGDDGVDDVGGDLWNCRLVFAHAASIVGKEANPEEPVRFGGRGGGR